MGLNVAIIGGGIGGLAAGVGLADRGHRVAVFERNQRIEPVGSAIMLWANALVAAEALGLREAIERRALLIPPFGPCCTDRGRAIRLLDWRGLARRVGPSAVIMRPDLVEVLGARLPPSALRLGEEVTSVAEDGIVATAAGEEAFDLVVGADGLRSVVRASPSWPSGNTDSCISPRGGCARCATSRFPPSRIGFRAWPSAR